MEERLQKLIARAGLASRRTAEALIRAGAVRVNGRPVTELGSKADPERDRIEVEGRRLRFPPAHAYLLFNKPRNYVCTASDPEGRPTIYRLLPRLRQRVFSVGRLPYEVEGLLILTSDGAFAQALLRAGLPQVYWIKLKGRLSEEERTKLRRLAGRPPGRRSGPDRLQPEIREVKPGANPWYEVRLEEPRRDRLRRGLFRLGHPVEKMKRVAIGLLRDSHLPPGQCRELSQEEVQRLRQEARTRISSQLGGSVEKVAV